MTRHLRSVAFPALCGLAFAGSVPLFGQAHTAAPDCSMRWPLDMTIVHLKNAGIATPAELDAAKTTSVRIASEARPHGIWHEVFHVHLQRKSGKPIDAVAVSDSSWQECSMSDVTVYVIAQQLPR